MNDSERSASLADDSTPSALAMLEAIGTSDELRAAVEQLPERERMIVAKHYFEGMRLKDLGKLLGVSEPRISQLHSRAIGRLREALSDASAAA